MRVAVKLLAGYRIEGLAIPFGTKDLEGEDFGADTDLALDWYPDGGRPILYDHGLNDVQRASVQGRQLSHEIRPDGVWIRGELDPTAKHHRKVADLIGAGALSFSSGSVPHLVKTDGRGHITRWPWVELSLTPIPAHPDAVVMAGKTFTDWRLAAELQTEAAYSRYLGVVTPAGWPR